MLSRRELLKRSLQGAALLSFGNVVPGFVASTARAAEAGKDNILVVIEFTGGNDGLNMVIPYADDLYHKARPTLRFTKDQVVRIDDKVGLNPSMRSLDRLIQQSQLSVVLGVGYPNPDRSHFESMDIWQSADPKRKTQTGWLGRAVPNLTSIKEGGVPAMHIGQQRAPLALVGGGGAAVSVNERHPFKVELGGGNEESHKARRKLMADLSRPEEVRENDLLEFVSRRQLQTLGAADRVQEALRGTNLNTDGRAFSSLQGKMNLIGQLIQRQFGTRVFYVSLDGFDTHSNQNQMQPGLLQQVADGITNLFAMLQPSGDDKRVRVMTFSEFGRRVQENGSKGTDHGAASCLLVAGAGLKPGAATEHPSLKDLDDGDLKFNTDFRRVYATMLDTWLGVDSQAVLNGKYDHLPALAKK
jgi:uncharacterized protein (DUF1501 family)